VSRRKRASFCFYCGEPLSLKTRTRDHMLPRSRGGRNRRDNIVVACKRCNTDKGSLNLQEFRLVMAFRAGVIQPPDFVFPGEMGETSRKQGI